MDTNECLRFIGSSHLRVNTTTASA
jgi:hypothetical protein